MYGGLALLFYFLIWKDPKIKTDILNFFKNFKLPNITTAPGSTTTTTTPNAIKHVIYNNGPVMKNPKVWFIFWGIEWDNTAIEANKDAVKTAMTMLFNSNYFDGLAQYGGITKPILGGFVDNKTYAVPVAADGNIPHDNVPKVVLDSITRAQVPNPDTAISPSDNFYFVWLPPGHYSEDYGGLHSSWGTTAGKEFFWGGVVYPATPHPKIPAMLDNLTQAFSHEIVDAMTDSRLGTGYVMDACPHFSDGKPGCEIEQYCGHLVKRVNGVLVEAYWSDQDGKCIVPGTVITPADNVSYNPVVDVY